MFTFDMTVRRRDTCFTDSTQIVSIDVNIKEGSVFLWHNASWFW